ncbi:MAG: gluconokinase, GntK/IdnK-type [Candidatus Sulfotelmatobacter sp.]
MILVLMGVSGVGKTVIGALLSARTGWKFEDADDYHSEESRRKMAAGIPLTDADRSPWLLSLHERVLRYFQKGESVILACSALKQEYREVLASGFAKSGMQFVYLHAPASLIKERIQSRHHPYMSPDLLNSQLATLEVPSDAWPISVAGSPEESVEKILARLREAGLFTTVTEIQ